MANPLKCDLCSKPATVHLTQILDNKVHKVDLCEDCAQEKGVTDPSGFSLADLLLKASLSPDAASGGIRCEQCGFTPADFKKQGRFGCPACYDAFKGILDPMLDGMHKGTVHSGKVPQKALERKSLYDKAHKARDGPERGDQGRALRGRRALPRRDQPGEAFRGREAGALNR